jgi:hypothetical protein
MPICTESFTAELDGLPVRLTAELDWVADGHELVRRFPHMFRRDPRDTARKRVSPSQVSRFRAPEVRKRACHDVAVTRRVWNAINEHVGSGLEAGGALLGERAEDGSFLLHDACGPGDNAARTSSEILHDEARYETIAAAYEGTNIRLLGRWHEHCWGDVQPSEGDLDSWKLMADKHGEFLTLIAQVPEDPYERMRLSAWVTANGRTTAATIYQEGTSWQ